MPLGMAGPGKHKAMCSDHKDCCPGENNACVNRNFFTESNGMCKGSKKRQCSEFSGASGNMQKQRERCTSAGCTWGTPAVAGTPRAKCEACVKRGNGQKWWPAITENRKSREAGTEAGRPGEPSVPPALSAGGLRAGGGEAPAGDEHAKETLGLSSRVLAVLPCTRYDYGGAPCPRALGKKRSQR